MRKKDNITPETDIAFFDKKHNKNILRHYKISKEFVFKKIEFYLVEKGYNHAVCYALDGELFSLWNHFGNGLLPGELMAEFRNGLEKSGLDENNIISFIISCGKKK